jgi:hypothetical protein
MIAALPRSAKNGREPTIAGQPALNDTSNRGQK